MKNLKVAHKIITGKLKKKTVLTNVKDTIDGPTGQFKNNKTLSATITVNNTIASSLSTHAKKAHIFDGLHSASLIYLVPLCDYDCISILDKNKILKGHINKTDGLWDIPISKPVRHRALAIITKYKTKTKIIQYLHGCCFITTTRTFLNTIKNGKFLTWLGHASTINNC